MNDAETYLSELRRALPIGARRRFVAEVREHFASAITAETERGVGSAEAVRLTIERLGPAHALAEQLVADLRSGALGRVRRLTTALTPARLVACATVVAVAIVAGALLTGRHSSPAQPAPRLTTRPVITLDPRTGEVRALVYALGKAQKDRISLRWNLKPVTYYSPPPRH